MLRRNRLLGEDREIVRLVSFCVLGIAVVAAAMAIEGWHVTSLLLGALIAMIATILVLRVARTVRSLATQSDLLRQSAAEAEEHYINVLRRILRFVEARDKYTRGHSDRVAALCEQIARKMGLEEDRCALMRQAGRLHDIGMLAIPEKILSARTRMGAENFRVVQKHSEIGYQVLRPLDSLSRALPAVRYHHERMNGTGYPAGLAGEEIPLEARILAVADAYDAMTRDRPHRPAMTPMDALRELQRCSPAGYDAECVEALAEIVHLPKLAEAFAARSDAARPSPLAATP